MERLLPPRLWSICVLIAVAAGLLLPFGGTLPLPARLAGRNIQLVGLNEALAQADLVVLLVDHKEFKELPAERLAGKRVIDTRGTWRDLA